DARRRDNGHRGPALVAARGDPAPRRHQAVGALRLRRGEYLAPSTAGRPPSRYGLAMDLRETLRADYARTANRGVLVKITLAIFRCGQHARGPTRHLWKL